MRSHRFAASARVRLCSAGMAALLTLAVPTLAPPSARAGEWIQVSCVNPDGSAAPNEGWTGFASGNPGFGSATDPRCAPGSPMSALLSQLGDTPTGAREYLQYQPPSGSKLVGGALDVDLAADGYGPNGAVSFAGIYEPGPFTAVSDAIFQCVAWLAACNPGSTDSVEFSGPVALAADRGGNLYLAAGCIGGPPGDTCNTNAHNGAWAMTRVTWAHLLLASNVSPGGANFSGSALQPGAQGTAHLVFTATDSGGPGVYQVAVGLDGRLVSVSTPNTNGGECVPVGTDQTSGALMFDWQQPCLSTEVVDVTVPTADVPDGTHALTVMVTDAAHNSSTVLDQTITTANPQTTPVPRGRRAVHTRFVINWSWNGTRTTLRRIKTQNLPRGGHVTVRCAGRRCPRLRVTSASRRSVGRLLRALGGRRFRAGDRLLITVTAPGRQAERIELRVRDNRLPQALLLKR